MSPDKKVRSFTPWSYVLSLLFAQLTHAVGLNDVGDALRYYGAKLAGIRRAVAQSRNTLSHANKHRDSDISDISDMMVAFFWQVLIHTGE